MVDIFCKKLIDCTLSFTKNGRRLKSKLSEGGERPLGFKPMPRPDVIRLIAYSIHGLARPATVVAGTRADAGVGLT
jgi:hypothetical protein